MKIFIVEDDHNLREIMVDSLKRTSYCFSSIPLQNALRKVEDYGL